jgi:hypothetical protein
MTIRTWTLVALAFAAGTAAEGAAPEVAHRPVACVPADRYARIVADAPDAVRADLQFRTDPAGGWYSSPMAKDGGRWVGYLPRASRGVARYEYRVAAIAADATSAETEATAIAVVDGGCDAESRADVPAPIVVTVPAAAPLVPPVPAGLSPAGVVAAQEKPRSNRALKIGIGAAAVAVGAAVAAGTAASSDDDPDEEPFRLPAFNFDRTMPLPGSTISYTYGELQVFVRMSREPALPITFIWQVELSGRAGVCATMGGVFTGAQRPVGLVFSNPIRVTGECGTTFDVTRLRVAIDYEGATVSDQTVELPFHFTP